ncbi:hypothetical protein BD626DRAFT_582802 [Schizophyllum amplum]|uniref:BTB domain-containing protein n=1 Tax=Schizophyllum amplum TaxID=97359 RepID=A0A550CJR9_9AGAR|nr:hypothetical protein BD626DRAFT_582802 [Auriculariopsis ampla]
MSPTPSSSVVRPPLDLELPTDDAFFNDVVHWDQGLGSAVLHDPWPPEPLSESSDASMSTCDQWLIDATSGSPSYPTPPASNEGTSASGTPTDWASDGSPSSTERIVSTAFNIHSPPSAVHFPDIELVSSDYVLFYVSCAVLAKASTNGFGHAVPAPGGRRAMPLRAEVLNLLLHAAYQISPAAFAPSLDLLAETAGRLEEYGMDRNAYVARGTVLFDTFASFATVAPMRLYVAAAANDLLDPARIASSHLLAYPMHALTDADAAAMGATYLKKLFMLQHMRSRRLRELLVPPQGFHAETSKCGLKEQRNLTHAWTRATLQMLADARPDTSSGMLRADLSTLKNETSCEECKKMLEARIWKMLVDWMTTPMTI